MQSRHAIYAFIVLRADTHLEDDAAHLSPPRTVHTAGSTQERSVAVLATTEVVFVLFDMVVLGRCYQVAKLDVLVG